MTLHRIAGLLACVSLTSMMTTALAQTPATQSPPQPATAQPAASPSTPAAPPPGTNIPSGGPDGVGRAQIRNSRGFPAPSLVEGQPIETRPPELAGDHPLFPGQTRAPYHATAPYTVTTITDQLKTPWNLQFLPDGRMLVTERVPGLLVIVGKDGAISQPISGLPAIDPNTVQVGLLDVALDPHFVKNYRIFFLYSEPVSVPGSSVDHSTIAIARATLDEAAGSVSDVKVIFEARPVLPRSVQINEGGRLAIGRDGTIFATIGDRSNAPPWHVAQDLDNDLGKIIHITPDGNPVKGNPFIGKTGALPEIWSFGHRNELGLAVDPATGALWEDEDGPRGGDELNLIKLGRNYGWPETSHGYDYPGELLSNGAVGLPGMEEPVYYWDPVIATSGLIFYKGNLFPQWKGSAFVTALRGQMLDRLGLSKGKVVNEEPLLVELHTRLRDVRIGPEGAVYVLTDNGKLLKLTPKD